MLMSDPIREAVGAVLGLVFGGIVLLLVSNEMGPSTPVDVDMWVLLFFLSAIIVAAATMYGVFVSIVGGVR
jgi:hypothetical protein